MRQLRIPSSRWHVVLVVLASQEVVATGRSVGAFVRSFFDQVRPELRTGIRGVSSMLAAVALLATFAAPAPAAPKYSFTKVADSVQDGFDPFSFECSAINNRGDVAFRTARGRRNE